MYYEFYLDVYILENLILYCFVLHLAGLIRQSAFGGRRILAGAAFGAGANTVLLISPIHKIIWLSAAFEVLFCLLAARICCKKASVKQWYGAFRAVCLSALALGGIWQFLSGSLRVPFPAAAPAGYGLVRAALKCWQNMQNHTRFIYDVTLCRGTRSAHLKGLLDSGNRLVQPVTARPVHIADFKEIKRLLTDAETRELEHLLELTADEQPSGKFMYIPYHSIGESGGVLPAMVLDSMYIKHGESAWSTRGVLIAVSKQAVSSGGEYQMILHPQILK